MAKKKTVKKDIDENQLSETEMITEAVTENIASDNDNIQDAVEENNHNTLCVLTETMTLDEIQAFVDTVLGQLQIADEIYVNLEQAQTISTATVQAIISVNRYACDKQKKIKWQNPSTGFSDAFNNLGFYSEMMKLEFA